MAPALDQASRSGVRGINKSVMKGFVDPQSGVVRETLTIIKRDSGAATNVQMSGEQSGGRAPLI